MDINVVYKDRNSLTELIKVKIYEKHSCIDRSWN